MDLQTAARQLFADYLTAWNGRDFTAIAGYFDYPAVFVLPRATVALAEPDQLIGLLEKIFAELDEDNFSHSTVGNVTSRRCNIDMAVVDARDVARLRKDGAAIEVIDAHYVMKRIDGKMRFAVAVVCESGWQESKGNA